MRTYGEHARFAAGFGWHLFKASMACFVHALVPAFFERTGSKAVLAMYDRLMQARAKVVAQHRAEAGQELAQPVTQ